MLHNSIDTNKVTGLIAAAAAAVVVVIYRQVPRSTNLPVLFLLRGRKSEFSPRRWRPVAPIHVTFGTAERHMGPLGGANFHFNRCTVEGTGPQTSDNFAFW